MKQKNFRSKMGVDYSFGLQNCCNKWFTNLCVSLKLKMSGPSHCCKKNWYRGFYLKDNIYFEDSVPTVGSYVKDLADIASGAGIAFAGKAFGSIIQYLHLIVVSRILGVDMLGGFVLGMTIISLVGIISRLGLDIGIVKFVAQYLGKRDMVKVRGVITIAILVGGLSGIIVALMLYFNAATLSDVFGAKPGLTGVLRVLGLTIPLTTIMLIALAATQGARVMKYTTYVQNFTLHGLNLLGVLISYLLAFRLNGVVGSFVLASIIATSLSVCFLLRTFPQTRQPVGSLTPIEHKNLFSVSISLGLVFFFSCIVLWTDTIMLGYFRSSSEVGVYNTVVKTALLTSLIYASFNAIFTPIIADLYKQNYLPKLELLYKIVAKWVFVISLSFFFLVALLAGEIMEIFGHEFANGSYPMIILAFSHLVSSAVGSTGYLLAMSGRHKLVLYNTIAILIINLLLNYYMIPVYGILGAACASCIATIFVNCLMVAEVYIIFKMHPFSLKFIKPVLIGSTLFSCLLILKLVMTELHYIVGIVIYSLLFTILFFSAIYKWSLAEEDEFILGMISARVSQLRVF